MTKLNNILEVKNLNFKYDKDAKFGLNNINLNFAPGKIYAILGHNGSGKSSLLNCISCINKNYEGEILYGKDNTNIAKLKDKDRAKILSLVPQINIGNSLNVYDTVLLGRKPYINISPMMVDYEMTSRAINMFNLNKLSLKKTSELSGGELQSVGIARAFAQNTPIMLMDEPTNNLDVKKQKDLFKTIKKTVKDKNLCVICVLHDINHALNYADHLIFMKNGKIVNTGSKNIVTNKLIHNVYGIDSKIIKIKNEKYVIV